MLGEGLSICAMTIDQSSDVWNIQLISECMLGYIVKRGYELEILILKKKTNKSLISLYSTMISFSELYMPSWS